MYLGIDSGGSKTAFEVIDNCGNHIADYRTIGAGKSVECDEILQEIVPTLEAISKEHKIQSICVNLGGKNVGQFQKTINSIFPQIPVSIYRESMGAVPLYIAEQFGVDIAILAGTGLIAIGKNADEQVICGGWGCDISDFGSGYWIGLQATIEALRSIDGMQQPTLLTKEVLGYEGEIMPSKNVLDITEKRDSIRKGILPVERSRCAALCKVVEKCANSGDYVAKKIFFEAGIHIAKLAICVGKKLKTDLNRDVLVIGGLTKCAHLWEMGFYDEMQKNKYNCRLNLYDGDMAKAAAKMAMKEGN